MRIIVDAFGGDNAPFSVVKGAAMAVEEYNVEILLTGDKSKIEECAKDNSISLDGIEIMHTSNVLAMHDDPGEIIKSKKDSSLAIGLSLLHDEKGDAIVSAGSTGALVIGGTFIVKRLKGIKRAALATLLPTRNGSVLIMDVGANAECRPEMLAQFSVMASVYMEKVIGINNPKVSLLNIGTEETKGGKLQLQSFALLKNAPINFIGNIEARDIPAGSTDIVITDGFTGNVVLKLTEGVAMNMFGMIKEVFSSSLKGKIAAALVMPGLKGLKKKMDYSEVGGAPLLGLSKPVIKAHGSSNANAIKNAIRQAIIFAEKDVISVVSNDISKLSQNKTE